MARTTGRTASRTRRLILDAASDLVSRHGRSVPLLSIAAAAGISKGGLLYHFPSKEDLLHDLATDRTAQFRKDVERIAADEEEQTPGRLTRAYIRVSFAHADDFAGLRDHIALAAHLMLEPELAALAQQDARQWRAALLGDGLDPAVIHVVVAAADGSNSAPLWGAVLTDTDRAELETNLLALTKRKTSIRGWARSPEHTLDWLQVPTQPLLGSALDVPPN